MRYARRGAPALVSPNAPNRNGDPRGSGGSSGGGISGGSGGSIGGAIGGDGDRGSIGGGGAP